MSSRACLALACVALLRAAPAHADGKLADAELGRYVDSIIEAYGGAKAVDALTDYRVEGKVRAHTMGDAGTFRRDFSAPASLRVDLTYPDRVETRIVADTGAWRGDPGKLEAVDDVRRTSMVYQMIRATAPWFLREHRDQLVHAFDKTVAKRTYRILRLDWAQDLSVEFWIDDQTRLVELVVGAIAVNGQQMTFATRYGDYRQVGSVLVPHKEESLVNQRHTGTTTLDTVELGAKKLGPFAPTGSRRGKRRAGR